ncbi:MAG: hypothetical protein KY396_02820, partial [Actinobacteria bacterium]|nr:hypothetical protein [Actinomycetota bacterium]
ESSRIQRRIADLAARIESGEQAFEMRELGDRLVEATTDLAGLRASLAGLRRRAETVRAVAADAADAA